MGIKTDIQWADSTLNLMVGCDGCELSIANHCYAEHLVNRYRGMKGWPEAFDKPRILMERLDPALKWSDLTGQARADKPWLNGRPRMIFLNDLGDTFTESLPRDWLAPALGKMAASPHIWLILSKRVVRMREFVRWWLQDGTIRWPANVWLGTSVTSQANIGRLLDLAEIPGVRRFVSFEPLLGRIDMRFETPPVIDWAILGGESGKDARPCDVAWIRSLRDRCRRAGVATFIKQLGSCPIQTVDYGDGGCPGLSGYAVQERLPPVLNHPKGGDWAEWTEDLRVREVPT